MCIYCMQAVWGRAWLHEHVPVALLQPGWTYLFEAVYRDNWHVIPYPFQALVLLGATDPQGNELPSAAALQQLARQLGVMAAPALAGTMPELTARLSVGCKLKEGATGAAASSTSSSAQSKALMCALPALRAGWCGS
jgi:hypothetical protein